MHSAVILKNPNTPKKSSTKRLRCLDVCSQRSKLTLEEMPVYYFSAKEECFVKHNPSTESYA